MELLVENGQENPKWLETMVRDLAIPSKNRGSSMNSRFGGRDYRKNYKNNNYGNHGNGYNNNYNGGYGRNNSNFGPDY